VGDPLVGAGFTPARRGDHSLQIAQLRLNLGHFLRIFGSLEEIVKKLVWLPTYHQARLLCDQFDVHQEKVSAVLASTDNIRVGDELLALYKMILKRLEARRHS
jgi:hypothetical protein